MREKQTCAVVGQRQIALNIFELTLEAKEIADAARPGQFVSLYLSDSSRILPRPISICEADAAAGTLRLVYRLNHPGCGLEEVAALQAGDRIDVLGPLGNGYPIEEAAGKRLVIVGGGIGIPPMLEVARYRHAAGEQENTVVALGYHDAPFLAEDFGKYGTPLIATEDGSAGVTGNVVDLLRAYDVEGDILYACGAKLMLEAVIAYAKEKKMQCYISMEERMACGIGACLACVCTSRDVDPHSHVHNKRICKDGPVFRAEEILL